MAQHRQPPPLPGVQDVTPALIADLQARSAAGLRTYGRPLQTHNGRNALQDALEETLDLAQYLKQALMEEEGRKQAQEAQQFREVVVVSSVVCYGCGRLVHANEVQKAAVLLEEGGDGAMAFYCRLACAGVKDRSEAKEPKPVPASYKAEWVLPGLGVKCRRPGCTQVMGNHHVQAVVTDGGWFYCCPEHAGLPHEEVKPFGGVVREAEAEHVDGGPYRKPNGGLSQSRRVCAVCGEAYDPMFTSSRKGCKGRPSGT